MFYQRQILASLAGIFCMALCVLSLIHNRGIRQNYLFAFFNFFAALWNFSDFAIFFTNHSHGLFYFRFTSLGACFLPPFLIHFIYEGAGIAARKIPKIVIVASYSIAGFLALIM